MEHLGRRALPVDAVHLAHLLAAQAGGKHGAVGPQPSVVAVHLVDLVAADATLDVLAPEEIEHDALRGGKTHVGHEPSPHRV